MRGVFSVQGREPNWKTVSSKLELNLHGQVSAEELYQAWCKCGPSWKNLSQALTEFPKYTRVLEKARKKAGMSVLHVISFCQDWQFSLLESVYKVNFCRWK